PIRIRTRPLPRPAIRTRTAPIRLRRQLLQPAALTPSKSARRPAIRRTASELAGAGPAAARAFHKPAPRPGRPVYAIAGSAPTWPRCRSVPLLRDAVVLEPADGDAGEADVSPWAAHPSGGRGS